MINIIIVHPDWQDSIEHKCCVLAGLNCQVSDSLLPEYIGLGSVEFCRSKYQWPACDPYPDWLPWGRKIFKGARNIGKAFFKPADIPKKFQSKIMLTPPDSPWVASEIIEFQTEWRAYIIDGCVLCTFCYSDFNNDEFQPFPWKVPKRITAAVDFGMTADGKMLPVEVNDPYAIGWYGSLTEYALYAEFLISGWKYMTILNGCEVD